MLPKKIVLFGYTCIRHRTLMILLRKQDDRTVQKSFSKSSSNPAAATGRWHVRRDRMLTKSKISSPQAKHARTRINLKCLLLYFLVRYFYPIAKTSNQLRCTVTVARMITSTNTHSITYPESDKKVKKNSSEESTRESGIKRGYGGESVDSYLMTMQQW